jgi:hypothetical protein
LSTYDHTELAAKLLQQAEAEANVSAADRDIAETRAKLAALPPPRSNPYVRAGQPNSFAELDALNLTQAEFEELSALEDDKLVERLTAVEQWNRKEAERKARHEAQASQQARLDAYASDPEAALREEQAREIATEPGRWFGMAPHRRRAEAERLGLNAAELEARHTQALRERAERA